MAKTNPVMKHAKPTLTAEQIAVEEFMESIPPTFVREGNVLADNSITSVIEHIDTSLDPIVESVVVADNLDELANDVDGITTAASFESYRRIFTQMTELSAHPVTSLEEFKPTNKGVRKLAKAIRNHAQLIRNEITVSFEEYANKADESIKTTLANYKRALKELDEINHNLQTPDGEVVVNHKSVWKLFHLNGELMDLRDFHVEVDAVKKLADAVHKGAERIAAMATSDKEIGNALDQSFSVHLMNNTTATVKDGRVQFKVAEVPPPDRSWSAGDFFWIFIFNFAGLAYRLLKGGSGDEKTKKDQSIKAIHKVIDEMKKMGHLVDGIAKDGDRIVNGIAKMPKERQAELKRVASPVLELASKTIQHVADATYGAKSMFEKMN